MRRIIRGLISSTFLMVLVSGVSCFWTRIIPGLFTDNKAAIAASPGELFFILSLGNPVTSATLVYTAVWQGLGKAKMPFYATTTGMWII